jgi:hypothetical protein
LDSFHVDIAPGYLLSHCLTGAWEKYPGQGSYRGVKLCCSLSGTGF